MLKLIYCGHCYSNKVPIYYSVDSEKNCFINGSVVPKEMLHEITDEYQWKIIKNLVSAPANESVIKSSDFAIKENLKKVARA